MVRYSKVRVGSKIILLLLVVLILFFFGLYWFDYLNLIDAKKFFSPVLKLVGVKTSQTLDTEDSLFLLEEERIKKQEQALLRWQEENENKEIELLTKEQELTQMVNAIQEKEKALNEREKSFNDLKNVYDSKNKGLRDVSVWLTGMKPDDAVNQLAAMGDQDVIDLMRITEMIANEEKKQSMVSVWLARLKPERAAGIERKMLRKRTDATLGTVE